MEEHSAGATLLSALLPPLPDSEGARATQAVAYLQECGDEPARILEIISPARFERYFAELVSWERPFDPEKVLALAARFTMSNSISIVSRA